MPPSLLHAADALLLGVAIIWGTTFPLGKLVPHHLAPFGYPRLRFALAVVLMAPLAWQDVRSTRGAAAILGGVVMGEVARREGREGAWT